jgi:hypothetical protein
MSPTVASLVAAALLWGGALLVDPAAGVKRVESEELFYYPSGKFLREAVLGYEQAAAALAWLRTVQYYGEHVRSDREFQMMYHLCDIVTDLDPRFEEPYVFGSFVLMTDVGDVVRGLKLLEKGRANLPDSWRLQFESGFVYYSFLRDYGTAGMFFRNAVRLPGAPPYAASFAAYMAQRSGSPEAALMLWTEFASRTDNPALKERAEEKIEELKKELAESLSGDGDS